MSKNHTFSKEPQNPKRIRGWFGIYDLIFPDTEEMKVHDFLFAKHLKKHLPKIGSLVKRTIEKEGESMLNSETRERLKRLGKFLLDLSHLKEQVILPQGGEELESLVRQVLEVGLTGLPIPLFTPFCPDWSRDSQGRYDFKSLGGEPSYIAEKFFREAPLLLGVFIQHEIPYQGYLIFANWGLETEINASDTYGRKLTQEEVRMCFESTFAFTDEKLLGLQNNPKTAVLFSSYRVVKMTDFFAERGINAEAAFAQSKDFFLKERRGTVLVEELHRASKELNRKRLGLSDQENRRQTAQGLAEYATLGYAFGKRGIILAAESHTSTKAYNLPKGTKLPVFFLKGKKGLHEGVNIL